MEVLITAKSFQNLVVRRMLDTYIQKIADDK